MKKLLIVILLIALPLCVFSQELGISKFSNMSEEELKDRLFWNNTGTVGSIILSGTGAAAIAVGSYYGVGCGILAVAIYANGVEDAAGALIGALMTAGAGAGFGLAILGYGAMRLSLSALDELNANKKLIKIELHQFTPTSYKDSPGIGIGISIPIHNNNN